MGCRPLWRTVVPCLLLAPAVAAAQSATPATVPPDTTPASLSPAEPRPIPDIPTLMHQVEAHQRDDEARLRNYIFRSTQTLSPTDGHGGVKRQEVRAVDVFWIDGVPVQKVVSKNGVPLSPDELKKEDDRIDKEVRKAKERREKNDSKGEQTDPHGNQEITVSRMLELGSFSNPRRVSLAGRDTIAVDYVGDPHTKTRNLAEGFFHDLTGTVWIDEQDLELARLECHTTRSFKVGAGLIANVREGTSFTMQQAKINNDVWLPTDLTGIGAARFLLLFSFDGTAHITDTDFRRFHTTSTLLPGVSKVTDDPSPNPATTTNPPPASSSTPPTPQP